MLRDWLARDGKLLLSERLMAETLGQMKNVLTENNYSISILETEKPERILETLFPPGDKKAEKVRARFARLCQNHALAAHGLQSSADQSLCTLLASAGPRQKDTLIKELVHQRLAGYYFLTQIEPQGDDGGYVVLLREIRVISRQIAQCITEGIDAKQHAAISAGQPRPHTGIHVADGELAIPVGMVSSPHLEHLMQSFALLFGRIGLPDPDPDYVSALWERQQSTPEENQ